MKRLSWTIAAAALLMAPGCGSKDEPGATSASSDGTTSDSTTGDTASSTSTTGTSTTGNSASDSATTSTSSTTTDSSGGSSGGCAGGFICEPDGGIVGECDPGLQDCMNPDEKCTGFVTTPGECCVDANHCVPTMGNKQFGEACTRVEGNDDCAPGFFCMTKTSGSTGDGICLEYCVVGDPSSCENGGECLAFNDGALPLCEQECDPLLQDCSNGQGCFAAFDKFVCAVPNLDEGGGNGDSCYTIQSCQPGLVCVSADYLDGCANTACCTPWCDLTEADPSAGCDGAEECVAWYEAGMAPPGHDDVGACTIPQ